MTLVSLPEATSFLSWTSRILRKLAGRCAECLPSMNLAIATWLDPVLSFSVEMASDTISA